jgi:fatty acid desaturase
MAMAEAPDHKAVLAALPAETRTALQARSDAAGLRHLALHWGLILLVGALIWARVPFWWALIPVQGVLLAFNFTLAHECTHQTPFRSIWLNEAVGRLAAFVIFLPFLWFRFFHMAHHRFTNDPARDPELIGAAKPATRTAYLWSMSGLPLWKSQIGGFLGLALGRPMADYVPGRAVRRVRIEAIITVLIYVLMAISSTIHRVDIWSTWLVPVLVGQPALRLYLLAEHGRCPAVANMLENSRTTYTTALMRLLAWNMPYHAEHHAFPSVPFHRLPMLNRLVHRHLRTTEAGYIAFHRKYQAMLDPKADIG